MERDPIIPAVRKELEVHLSREDGKKLQDLESYMVVKRPFSTVRYLKCRTSDETLNLVMKTIINHPVNISITERENQARVEFNILQFLYPNYHGVSGCAVPRPILVIPEMETYLMEYVEGTLLMDNFRFVRMLSSSQDFMELKESMNLCGQWLKSLHEFTKIENMGIESLDSVVKRAEHRLELIESQDNSGCPKEFRKTVMDYLERQLAQLSGEDIPVSGRHGDYSPYNVIVGSRGITVIDFMGYQRDPIPVDICKMLVFLEDEGRSVTSSARRVAQLSQSFMEGYGPLPYVPEPAVLLCEAMQRIVSLWAGISYPKKRLHHWIDSQQRVSRQVKWFYDGNNRKSVWSLK